jgi:hypothetical protein
MGTGTWNLVRGVDRHATAAMASQPITRQEERIVDADCGLFVEMNQWARRALDQAARRDDREYW